MTKSQSKKQILFIVPDGVGIKNYLYSDLITHIKEESEISIWSTLPVEAFLEIKKIHDLDFNYKRIVLVPEKSIVRILRESATYARLVYYSVLKNNSTILLNWRRPKRALKTKLLYHLAEGLGYFLSKKYSRILNAEKRSYKLVSKRLIQKYAKALEELSPTSIFITHQRVPGLMPICIAAKEIGIKTTTAIFSWDNLPKARLAVKTDNYLVWSEWMQKEMSDYYPEIPDSSLYLVGTPQFEFYLEKQKIVQRERFANKYGLDSNKLWICFSGDDLITSPYDHYYLADLLSALYKDQHKIQIIFRRCPVDFSSRYDDIINQFKDIVVAIDPLWNVESEANWVSYFPKYEDVNLQVNIAFHSELVINLGSTMALDFITFNKPCLYLNYNPVDNNSWSTEIIYKFQHFRTMKDLNPVGWINTKKELRTTVLKTLDRPNNIAPDRKLWMNRIVLHPLDNNSKKIAQAII